MSRKAKYTVEQKVKAAERYIRGEASAAEIAAEMGMPASGRNLVGEWAAAYRENTDHGDVSEAYVKAFVEKVRSARITEDCDK